MRHFLLVVGVSFLASIQLSQAREPTTSVSVSQPPAAVVATKEIEPVAAPKEVAEQKVSPDRLAEERGVLERQNERQFGALEKLIDKAIYLLGGILAVASAVLLFLFGKSLVEFKSTFKAWFEVKASEIVETEAKQLRQRYERLQGEVDALTSYKDRTTIWVLPHNAKSPDAVVSALNASGIKNPAFLTPTINGNFDLGSPDLVILSYDGSAEALRVLGVLAGQLKAKSPPVPLLIYSFTDGPAQVRLGDAEFEKLAGFDWFVPVNFPAQLLAQALLLIRQSRQYLGEAG